MNRPQKEEKKFFYYKINRFNFNLIITFIIEFKIFK